MAPRSAADALRHRAESLRRAAVLLDGAPLPSILLLAGDDTWRGPSAAAFLDDVRAATRSLGRAHDDLVCAALRLDRAADDAERAERAALLAPAAGPR